MTGIDRNLAQKLLGGHSFPTEANSGTFWTRPILERSGHNSPEQNGIDNYEAHRCGPIFGPPFCCSLTYDAIGLHQSSTCRYK